MFFVILPRFELGASCVAGEFLPIEPIYQERSGRNLVLVVTSINIGTAADACAPNLSIAVSVSLRCCVPRTVTAHQTCQYQPY